MGNKYWDGDEHAVLKKEDVSASWGSGHPRRIDAANRAFCIWYHGQKTLSENVTSKSWSLMFKSMNDCGRTGWGFGVSDLEEAFDHLIKNNGKWTDNNTANYYGGKGKSYKWGLISDVPEGCANFLTAVDNQLPKLKKAITEYQKSCQALQTIKLTKSPSDWEKVKTHVDNIKTSIDYGVKPLTWIMPATITAHLPINSNTLPRMNNIEDLADGIYSRAGKAVTFLDTVGKIHDCMTIYVDATKAFDGDRRVGVAFAALSYALTFVPVLGGFYGAIVQKIPGLVIDWKDFMDDYHRTRLHPERYLKAQPSRKPAWRCDICGSSGGY